MRSQGLKYFTISTIVFLLANCGGGSSGGNSASSSSASGSSSTNSASSSSTGSPSSSASSSSTSSSSSSSSSGTFNSPPTVEAGNDRQVSERQTVALTGTANDVDGAISAVEWRQLEGPSVDIANPDSLDTRFEAPSTDVIQILQFQLTVTDDQGASASDLVIIEVNPVFEVNLNFPVNYSQFDGDSLNVSGNIRDFSGNASEIDLAIDVAGVSHSATIDENGNWRTEALTVPENNGQFLISVNATDSSGQNANTEAIINNEKYIGYARFLQFNPVNHEVYFYEFYSKSIVSVDLNTGEKSELSGPNRGNGPDLDLVDMDIDIDRENPSNSRLIGLQNSNLIAINIQSGNRTALIDDNLNPTPALSNLNHLTLHPSEDIAYVSRIGFVDSHSYYEIIKVELETGNREMVSGIGIGTGENILWLADIALDTDNNNIFALDANQSAIIKIDLNNDGNRTLFSNSFNGEGPTDFLDEFFSSLFFDVENDLLYVQRMNGNLIHSIDNSGKRTPLGQNISSIKNVGHGSGLSTMNNGEDLLVLLRFPFHLVTLNIENNSITEIFNENVSAARPLKNSGESMVVENKNTLIFSSNTEDSNASIYEPFLNKYEIGTGKTETIIKDYRRVEMQADKDDNVFYSANDTTYAIYQTEIHSFNETTLSSALKGRGEIFENPITQLAVDPENQKIYAMASPYEWLMEIDIGTGDRQLVVNTQDLGLEISNVSEMHYNTLNGLIYLSIYIDADLLLYTIDPATGFGTLVTDYSFDKDFTSGHFSLSNNEESIYLFPLPGSVQGRGFIAKLQLSDLSYSVIANNSDLGKGIRFTSTGNIILDENRGRAFLIDGPDILLLDLATGNRVRLLEAHNQ